MIGLPTMGSVNTMLMTAILSWVAEAAQGGKYDLMTYHTIGVSPVDEARNCIVEEFLKTDCSHLLFIDSDTIPPRNAITKLLSADKGIVSALTPIVEHDENRKNDSQGHYRKYNVVGWNDKHVNEYIGLVPCKGAGSSCILIKREVFEKMKAPWYRFVYEDDNGKKELGGRPVIIGEDIYFTARAIGELGIMPHVDTSIICKHSKSIYW